MTPFAFLFLLALYGSAAFAVGRSVRLERFYENGYRRGFRQAEQSSFRSAAELATPLYTAAAIRARTPALPCGCAKDGCVCRTALRW